MTSEKREAQGLQPWALDKNITWDATKTKRNGSQRADASERPKTGTSDLASIGPKYVQVPLDLPRVPDAVLTVWALVRWRTGENNVCWPTQKTIQRDLGRAGNDASNVCMLIGKAVSAGLLEVRRRHVGGKTRNFYRPLLRAVEGDGRNWVDLPVALLHALAAGEARPEHVGSAVRWLTECREQGGWSKRTAAELVAEWGQSDRTVRRHRVDLVRLGVLDERPRRGASPITAPAGKLPPAPAEVPVKASEQVGKGAGPRSQITGYPGHESPVTPVIDHRQNYPEENYPEMNYPTSAPAGAAVTAVDAHTGESAAAPRSRNSRGSEIPRSTSGEHRPPATPAKTGPPSRDAWEVLASLPSAWRPRQRWVRRRMAARIERALTTPGFTAEAIVSAARRYGPGDLAEHHSIALRELLRILAADLQAVPDCEACAGSHRPGTRCIGDRRAAANRGADFPSSMPALPAAPPGECVACGAAGAPTRPELPLRSAVCESCWEQNTAEAVAA